MKKLKTAIIGTGFIGPVHAEAVRRTGLSKVVAIAGSSQEKAREKADQLGIKDAYADYRRMLLDSDIDVVHITTPNHLHFQMAKDVLASGRHVVCEKPLAMTSQEGKELLSLAQKSGLVAAVNLNCRAYPMIQQARAMVEAGEVGEVFCVNGSYHQDWLFLKTDYNWRLEPDKSGESRAVADIGSHWFDAIQHVTGDRVTRVMADFATFHKTRKRPLKAVETYANMRLSPADYEDVPIHTEDYAAVLFRLGRGGHGTFTANQAAAGRKNKLYFEIYGSKCSLAFDSERPNELFIGRRDGSNLMMMKDPSLMHPKAQTFSSYPGGHIEGFADSTKHTMMNIYKAILGQGKQGDYPDFNDGVNELLLCEAVCRSHRNQAWEPCEAGEHHDK